MTPWYLDLAVLLAGFAGMECVAWLSHKYIMHGLLWTLHSDHHHKKTKGFFERNDFFFLVFALPGIACMYFGTRGTISLLFFLGLGITLYGMAYFFVHDIFIHQRFKLLRNTNSRYLLAVRRAHKSHHKHLDRHQGECFGMLWVPPKYFKKSIAS